MKILSIGCSFVSQEDSWAKIVSNHYPGSKRLGFSAAGNFFISRATQEYILKEKFDLVLVMWSGYTRLDLPTQWIDKRAPEYTWCASKKKFNNLTVDWLFSGALNGGWSDDRNDQEIRNIFFNLYQEMDHEHLAYLTLIEIISLQNFLKIKSIPYYFMSYVNFWNKDRINPDLCSWYYDTDLPIEKFSSLSHLFDEIDWSRWIFSKDRNGLYEICQDDSWLYEDHLHPGKKAHEIWANKILEKIKEN